MRICLLLGVIFGLLPAIGQAQTCRALIVTVENYPTESGWNEIHTAADATLLIPMLQRKGFANKNIATLVNEKATKAGILNDLDRLYGQSRSGDHIYLHFSCHGQQMLDYNGDEADGLDEALIPYDAQRRFQKDIYEGENHLRDDELGIFLDRIRTKIGPSGSLVLVIDACHSGTANRDNDEELYVRGTTYIFAPHHYSPYTKVLHEKLYNITSDSKMSPVTVFAACQPDQLNYEYLDKTVNVYYGTLTYALCKVAGVGGTYSVAEFYDAVAREMEMILARYKIKQTPYLETTNENQRFQIGR